MELEDFETGEKISIAIPEGCILIDKKIDEANLFGKNVDYAFWNVFDDKILVDFFPNHPTSINDIPLFSSDKEGCFKVIVQEDNYQAWLKQKRKEEHNAIEEEQYIKTYEAIYNKKDVLRQEGDYYRNNSQYESAITSYAASLKVNYKTLSKQLKFVCISLDLLSLDGLIDIYHKQNRIEKIQECIEQAILLTTPDTSNSNRFWKEHVKYKRMLNKQFGIYQQNIIPPESHMNTTYSDLTNYMELIDNMRIFTSCENGRATVELEELGNRLKLYDYFLKLMERGEYAEGQFDYKTATDIYERLVAEGFDRLYPYDRLMHLYNNYKLYEDEVRVIENAIKVFRARKKDIYHNYDKRIERWEKRLISAKKRLKCSIESREREVKKIVKFEVNDNYDKNIIRIIRAIGHNTMSAREIKAAMQLNGENNFRNRYLQPSIKGGYLSMLYPDDPSNSNQAYLLTEKGQQLLLKYTVKSQ